MTKEFQQIEWDNAVEEDCRQLVRLAVREDLGRAHDWTTVSLVASETQGRAAIVARQAGVIAGLPAARLVLDEMDQRVEWLPGCDEGARVAAGQVVATISGSARSLLSAERILLNLLGRICGVATLTSRYVDAVKNSKARVYDTRKTIPGWRRLDKYAVHVGGGSNHRTGLFDAILIKDNHLALGAEGSGQARFTPAEAVTKARAFLRELLPDDARSAMIVEVEVDTLEQLAEVLTVDPDIVLLDNMHPGQLAEAVALRDRLNPPVQLEASGGVNLDTIAAIAASGVDRISVGALTHSAVCFDVALDWGGKGSGVRGRGSGKKDE